MSLANQQSAERVSQRLITSGHQKSPFMAVTYSVQMGSYKGTSMIYGLLSFKVYQIEDLHLSNGGDDDLIKATPVTRVQSLAHVMIGGTRAGCMRGNH
jgi:hypothetical protein